MKQKLILETEKLFRKASEILRQTKLVQTYGTFSDEKGKFCAMGAVYAEYGWDGKSNWDKMDFNIIGEQLGFYDGNSHEYCTDDGCTILHMNDTNRLSFSEIADYLETKGL